MSHQEPPQATENAHQLQQVFVELLPPSTITETAFRNDSFWKPRSLVFAALLWAWSGHKTLTDRFEQAVEILQWLQFPIAHSYQGFLKRLGRWSRELSAAVQAAFQQRMLIDLADAILVEGWLLLAADGSRCAVPRTVSNEARFAMGKERRKKQKSNKRSKKRRQRQRKTRVRRRKKQTQADREKKAASPQIWLTAFYAVGVGLPWDWRIGPGNSSEREHVLAMLETLPENAMLTMDAGFVGYGFWRQLQAANASMVVRVGANVKVLNKLGYVRRTRNIVYVWPDQAQRKEQPPLVLRLVCFSGGKEDIYLATNVLNEHELSDRAMLDIYRARWGVELFYRDFKQTFERGKLRSKSADNAELEAQWSLLGLWAMSLYTSLQHHAAGVSPARRSIANMLRAFRKPMHQYAVHPKPGADLHSRLLAAVLDDYERTSSKSSRNGPNRKTKRRLGPPEITTATSEQITAAKKIRDTISTKRLTA